MGAHLSSQPRENPARIAGMRASECRRRAAELSLPLEVWRGARLEDSTPI